jgi:predicted transcriptional regulator
MKIMNVKIGIKSLDQGLADFVDTANKIKKGLPVKKRDGVYFTSIEAFRKALTPKRLELLHLIRKEKPESIRSLARISGRDIKNVTNDVQYLARLGLLELNESGKNLETVVNYEKILLEIAV